MQLCGRSGDEFILGTNFIGLPPTPVEMETFLAAWNLDARKSWNELIGRLLASLQSGERWKQQWLDMTRYADTGGMAIDF